MKKSIAFISVGILGCVLASSALASSVEPSKVTVSVDTSSSAYWGKDICVDFDIQGTSSTGGSVSQTMLITQSQQKSSGDFLVPAGKYALTASKRGCEQNKGANSTKCWYHDSRFTIQLNDGDSMSATIPSDSDFPDCK